MKSYLEGYGDAKAELCDSDKHMKELDLKLDAIRKENIKLQTANIERSRIDRNVSRREMYCEYVCRT